MSGAQIHGLGTNIGYHNVWQWPRVTDLSDNWLKVVAANLMHPRVPGAGRFTANRRQTHKHCLNTSAAVSSNDYQLALLKDSPTVFGPPGALFWW